MAKTSLFDRTRREFMARYLADVSKAIFAVALASKFFIDLINWMRILLPVAGLAFFVIAFLMQPKGETK